MARDISIAISAKDNFSQAITTMRNANQAFNKDLTGLQSKLDQLNKTKSTLKVDTNKAKTELKEAEKQFEKTGDAADKLNLELANANYENARRNLSLVSDNAKQAEKDMRSLTNAVSKSENRASNSVKSISSEASILSRIATSGAVGMAGNVLSDIVNSRINSAFGGEAGTLAGSSISSAAIGASIGTMIAPGIGTALGALGGAALGYIQGQNTIFENKDNAFKSYYEDAYNNALNTQSTAMTNGSGIASVREANKISFSTLLGGDDKASEFLADVTDFAQKTPFEYDDLTSISKTLLAYGYKQNEILPLLEKVGDTGSALGLSKDDMTWVASSLGRMQTTGKTTLEYLNPLLERGIDVWSYLAEASGKTKKEVQEMVSKGLVPGETAAKVIADYMGYDFSGNMEKQSKTYSGLVSNLEDSKTALENAMGEGYNSSRKSGLQDQINWMSGDSGQKMQEAYNKIGQWKASLENQSEQYQRDAMSAVMSGNINVEFSDETKSRLAEMYQEYTKYASDDSKEAGAKMGELLAEAQAIATNEYNASDGAQLALQSNKTLAENIKNDSALQDSYWDAGYTMGQQFTLGLTSAMTLDNTLDSIKSPTKNETGFDVSMPKNPKDWLEKLWKEGKTVGKLPTQALDWITNLGSHYAYGLNYVPYNDYPALLHEGERVLTASENRNYGNTIPPITITGNNFNVRQEADILGIAREIANLMNNALVLS